MNKNTKGPPTYCSSQVKPGDSSLMVSEVLKGVLVGDVKTEPWDGVVVGANDNVTDEFWKGDNVGASDGVKVVVGETRGEGVGIESSVGIVVEGEQKLSQMNPNW